METKPKVLMEDSKWWSRCSLLALIEENILDEAEARENYYKLLQLLDDILDIQKIQKIILDEIDHADDLRKMALKYSGILKGN